MKQRFMIALCCLVLLLQLLPIVPFAEQAATVTEIPQELYYCREALKTLENSEALLFAYDNIVAGIDACAPEIIISEGRNRLSLDEFNMVLEATRRDHTEQFWMGTSYTPYVNSDETLVEKMVPTYSMTGEELEDAKTAFEQAINLMLARLTPGMSEYEMEKALHDMLAVQVSYVSAENAHNAYGALVEGKAVCEGYAEALQCLLQRVGIQSVEVFGYGINPATGVGEPHAWNIVRIDGQYYVTDLTWNDQDNQLLYAYFNQTSAIMAEDHEQWRIGRTVSGSELKCEVFELPVCTATAENYFTKENLRITNYTVESIGKLLKDNGLAVSLFIDSDVQAFEDWYNQNIVDIATVAGVSGKFYYGSTQIGRQVRIYFETCEHKQLTKVNAKAPTCDEDGNSVYYVCQSEDCGKWFSDPEAQSEIVNRDSIIIFSIGHDWSLRNTEDEATLVSRASNCQEKDTYWYICATCNEVSDTYTFVTEAGAHVDENGDGVCDLCADGESPFDFEAILNFIMDNIAYVGGGGGGVILLIVILAIVRKAKE